MNRLDRKIVRAREKGLTFKAIGLKLGLSESGIRQKYYKAIGGQSFPKKRCDYCGVIQQLKFNPKLSINNKKFYTTKCKTCGNYLWNLEEEKKFKKFMEAKKIMKK